MRSEREGQTIEEEIRADRADERLVKGLEKEYRSEYNRAEYKYKKELSCLLCGKTYGFHLDKPRRGTVPRVGCHMLKSGFVPDIGV